MTKEPRPNYSETELAALKEIRKQLADFNPAAGTIEVIFNMPDNKSVRIPVVSKAKTRIISKEIRNYLAEEQLIMQCWEE